MICQEKQNFIQMETFYKFGFPYLPLQNHKGHKRIKFNAANPRLCYRNRCPNYHLVSTLKIINSSVEEEGSGNFQQHVSPVIAHKFS